MLDATTASVMSKNAAIEDYNAYLKLYAQRIKERASGGYTNVELYGHLPINGVHIAKYLRQYGYKVFLSGGDTILIVTWN